MMTYEEYKAIMDGFLSMDDIEYRQFVQGYQYHTEALKKELLEMGVEKFKETFKDNIVAYVTVILAICEGMILFPDPSFDATLEALGVGKRARKWFIGIEAINRQFYEISQKNVLVVRQVAIVPIVIYIHSKIKAEILADYKRLPFNWTGKDETAIKEFKKLFRRRKDRIKSGSKIAKPLDILMEGTIRETQSIMVEPWNVDKYLISSLLGDTEKYFLASIMAAFIDQQERPNTEFIDAISGLLLLLLKNDKKLMTQEGLLKSEALYGNNYKRYVTNRVGKMTKKGLFFRTDR
jgi:hypothetical protein